MKLLDNVTDKFFDLPTKAIIGGSLAFVGLSIWGITYLGALSEAEFAEHQCVQTQEMRTVPALETGVSSNGSVVMVTGQRIEFKYNCNDEPRWK